MKLSNLKCVSFDSFKHSMNHDKIDMLMGFSHNGGFVKNITRAFSLAAAGYSLLCPLTGNAILQSLFAGLFRYYIFTKTRGFNQLLLHDVILLHRHRLVKRS